MKKNTEKNKSAGRTEMFKRLMTEDLGGILLYLVACALHDSIPDETIYTKTEGRLLYAGAKSHSVLSMVAFALEHNDYKGIPEETAAKFRAGKDRAIRKNMLLNAERELLFSYMEKEGIRYLPMKGILLQDIYPRFGMRQMADNDIFYDETYQMKIKEYMESRGFSTYSVGRGVHDTYYKAPVYNFEMHTGMLADLKGDGNVTEYYRNVWEFAVKDADRQYGYHLKKEDFYIYIIAHAYKHHAGSGTGIRTLSDVYLLNHVYPDLDRDYIQNRLEKLTISDFEKDLHSLSQKLLSDPSDTIPLIASLSRQEAEKLRYILGSGTYGNTENSVKNSLRRQEGRQEGSVSMKMRFRYYKNRLFPGRDFLYPFYPLAKYRILIPLVWLQRILSACTVRRHAIRKEIHAVQKQKRL